MLAGVLGVVAVVAFASCSRGSGGSRDASSSDLLGGSPATSGGGTGESPATTGGGAAAGITAGSATSGGIGVGEVTAANGGLGTDGGATGGATGTDASATTGGSIAGGETTTAGGTVATGGIAATGGTSATGGSQASGGTAGAGGIAASAGTKGTGGATSTAGATATVGATATGGTQAAGGATATGGNKTTGGTTTAAGGTQTMGGTTGTGGAASDRCDVGIYNAASPPQVLALSGNLATHDPSAIESNGTYYEFHTGLGAKTSTNSTSWNAAATPFGTPAWMTTAVPGVQGLWAPDISFFAGQYHLYYAGSYPFGANTSCIGHATRTTMNAGAWTDQGSSIICSSSANNWNAIDPNLIVDTAGVPWLVFGSWWSGIQIIQLNSQGTARANSTITLIAGRGGKGIEGAFMVRRCGYYYLFTSWDACCQGFNSTYNIRVGRSTSVDSGFVDKDGVALTAGGGTLVAAGNGTTFNGPGGQSVMIAGSKAYLVYHAYAPDSVAGGSATLRIADLVWDSNGWPVPVGP
jgi:arabinan endo-1,5-alpha-L-arabinosidase